jgi:hypothetical protein
MTESDAVNSMLSAMTPLEVGAIVEYVASLLAALGVGI